MTLDLLELANMSDADLLDRARTSPEWLEQITQHVALAAEDDLKRTQLHYYTPSNPMAMPVLRSTAPECAINGGNRSTKTTTGLVELAIGMTGHIPQALMAVYPLEKVRGPIRARVVCNSLTDTLEPVIKPKLQWDKWNGVGDPREGRGHWGLIPQHTLQGGTWERAYSEKYRTLHAAFCTVCPAVPHTAGDCRGCRRGLPMGDPVAGQVMHYWPAKWAGMSTCQMLSYDQDLSAFAGSSMHFILHDELPPADVYRENRMRVLDVQGRILTAFTPPDEGGQNRADVSWFYDEIFEPGLPGPAKSDRIDTFCLFTEENAILSAAEIHRLAERMTEDQRRARLRGEFVHLSGVIFPIFSQRDQPWCLRCAKRVILVDGRCGACDGDDVTMLNHVVDPFEIPRAWPVVCVADPHPRKKDVFGWFAVSPADDVYLIREGKFDGTYKEIAEAVFATEQPWAGQIVKRLGDPNILTQTDDRQKRGMTMRQGYDEAGLRFDLANDEMVAGIRTVNEALRPDARTRFPRFVIFRDCPDTIQAMGRWCWDEWTRQGDKEAKERPRDKFKDECDLVRYMLMDRPTFHGYKMGLAFQHRRGRRG